MDDEPVVMLSTAGPDTAGRIARELVEKHLAACVNLSKIRSCYRWEGEICDDEETLLVIKTVKGKIEAVKDAILTIHTYELPEILVIPVITGSGPYLRWLKEETMI